MRFIKCTMALFIILFCYNLSSPADIEVPENKRGVAINNNIQTVTKIDSMERITIVGYKPFPGKETELLDLMKTHWQILRDEELVSDRESIIMQAADGTVVEVFGWKSKHAIESAHANPIVQKMWEAYGNVCEYLPVGELEECKNLFSEFTPVN